MGLLKLNFKCKMSKFEYLITNGLTNECPWTTVTETSAVMVFRKSDVKVKKLFKCERTINVVTDTDMHMISCIFIWVY